MAELITPDLCVIGAGLGGLTAAAEARALGASVVLVERDKLGGDYLNTGVIPAKALTAAAAQAAAIRSAAAFGLGGDEPRINSRKVHDFVAGAIASLAPQQDVARVEASGARVIMGEAKFTDPRTVAVGDVEIRARRFIIATGARTAIPPIPGLEDVPFFTSETIFDNTRKLSHLAIVGAGPTGLELGQALHRLGAQVTLIEPDVALARSDPELREIALQRLREEGVVIREITEVAGVRSRAHGIGLTVKSGETEELLDVSHILIAQRRIASIEALDLDKAGIRRAADDAGRLSVDAGLRTSNSRVYAIGEAAGSSHYAPLAAWHAGLVVRNAVLGLPIKADPAAVPSFVATDPEIAEVGLSEARAKEKLGDRFSVVRASFSENDRARVTRQTYGMAKLIVRSDGAMLGAGVVGDRAGELIALFSYAIANRMPAASLAGFVAPHPTLSGIARELGREYSRSRAVSPLQQRLAALVRLTP